MKKSTRVRGLAALAITGIIGGTGVVTAQGAQAVEDNVQTCRVKGADGTVYASYKVTRYNGKTRDKVVVKPIYYKTSKYRYTSGYSVLQNHRFHDASWTSIYFTKNPWSQKTINTGYTWNARAFQVRLEMDHKTAHVGTVKYCMVYFY